MGSKIFEQILISNTEKTMSIKHYQRLSINKIGLITLKVKL